MERKESDRTAMPGGKRLAELDFLRAVCIILMVVFHLVSFSERYPFAKQVVYTFHMPVFLVISGFLAHVQRPARTFFRNQFRIFLPYVLLELPYTALSGILGVRGGDSDLSFLHLMHRVFLDPLGPYWYLHTLLVCNISLWATERLLGRMSLFMRLSAFAAVLFLLDQAAGLVGRNVIHYFLGAALARTGWKFTSAFPSSPWALLPCILLCCLPWTFRSPVGEMAMTWCVSGFLLGVFARCRSCRSYPVRYIGQNTLPILLFSPVFTMLAKGLVPLLAFDGSRMLFMVTAVTAAVAGSLGIARVLDRMGLSPLVFGRRTVLSRPVMPEISPGQTDQAGK